jgi:hypothetical protein
MCVILNARFEELYWPSRLFSYSNTHEKGGKNIKKINEEFFYKKTSRKKKAKEFNSLLWKIVLSSTLNFNPKNIWYKNLL